MNALNRLRFPFLLLLLVPLLSACGEPPYNNVDNTQLKELLAQGVPLYDIRRAEEWRQTGVVEGSVRRTFFDASGRPLADFLPEFTRRHDKNEPVALICRTGNRTSALATYLVEELGYTQVYNVRDGITGWMAAGNPVQR